MMRFLFALLFALAIAQPSFAQDMPLSQILIDGEGWKKADSPGTKPKAPGRVMTHSLDGWTMFEQVVLNEPFLRATPVVEGGAVNFRAARYAPLRTRRGESAITVTGLATDKDGRIYAATDLGVQVFDPTGRLCGALTPAAEGKPEHLAFEGDKLTHWIGDTKYARKLNTTGAK